MSIAAVEKAFAVLEFLASTGRSVSLQEVTQAARLPKPTTYRLLRSLQNMGYVERPSGSRNYLMGSRASRLAVSDPHAHLKAMSHPLIQQLHAEFNETVNLGILSGQRVLYLEYLETTQSLRYIVVPGESDAYYNTALGRAVVSGMNEKQIDQLLAKTVLHRQTPHTVKTKAELREEIIKARSLGVAEEIEESAEGVSCMAVNLSSLGFPHAAISIAVPVQRLTPQRKKKIHQRLRALAESHK